MSEKKIISVLIGILLAAIAIAIVSSIVFMTDNTPNLPCEAELIMPGNTVVIGTCTKFNRISSGWVKAEIDGKVYSCNEWRIVLRGN